MTQPVLQPHIGLVRNQIPKFVLICGDPARAELISTYLDNVVPLAKLREYHSFSGTYKGVPVGVISHGVGSSGMTICIEELIKIGASLIIRVGTAGSLQDNIGQGDIVIAEAAAREEGTTRKQVPEGFPACSSYKVVAALAQAAEKIGANCYTGVVVSDDLFYPAVLPNNLELYRDAGALAVEMEFSALYVTAAVRGILAGGVCAIDGNPLKWDSGDYDPHGEKVKSGKDKAIRTALDSLVILHQSGVE